MKKHIRDAAIFLINVSLAIFLATCKVGSSSENENGNGGGSDTYDVDLNGIPQFVDVNYIELNKIHQISRFRSGIGHDYSDDFESCRSMKHYFQPKSTVNWSEVQIFSPVAGTVANITVEWAGAQIRIRSAEYPAFFFIIFHVSLIDGLNVGAPVSAGQQIGTHIGSQTMSDIAVGVSTPGGWKLISYFDTITNSVFQAYQARGMDSRQDAVISREERDGDPLTCDGETFDNSGSLDNWVVLN